MLIYCGGVHMGEESRMFHQDLVRPLGMKAESEERPQQLVGYKPGAESGGLDLKERRVKISSESTCFPD